MSLVLLQSEKQITPTLKDLSDEPDNFINIFRKPITIKPNQTVELVSFGFNKKPMIINTVNNNVMYYRVGNFTTYLTKKIVLDVGTYTIATFTAEIQSKLNASMNLNQYSFTVTYDINTDAITINMLQTTTPTFFNSSITPFGQVAPADDSFVSTYTEVNEPQMMPPGTNIIYQSNITTTIGGGDLDHYAKLQLLNSIGTPIFSNNGSAFITLESQSLIEGVFIGASPPAITMNDNVGVPGNTGNWTAYTGANGYNFQFTVNSQAYYVLLVGGPNSSTEYVGEIKDDSGTDIPFNERGIYWIVSQTDVAVPSPLTNANKVVFSLVKMKYDTSAIASFPVYGSKVFNRTLTELTTVWGDTFNFDGWTMTDVFPYCMIINRGLRNGCVGLNKFSGVPPSGNSANYITLTGDNKITADYSMNITQTATSNDSNQVTIKLHGYRVTGPSNTLEEVALTIPAGDITGGIELTGNNLLFNSNTMNTQLRIILSPAAGPSSAIQFKLQRSYIGSNYFTDVTAFSGTFKVPTANKWKQEDYPVYGVVALGSGSYGQNMGLGSLNAYRVGGILSLKTDNTVTGQTLLERGVANPDFLESTVAETNLGALQNLGVFMRFKVVPDDNISSDNSAGANLELIDKRDCESTDTRNATQNNASLGNDLNFLSFSRTNGASSGGTNTPFSYVGDSGLETSYVAENINVLLPDFPIEGYNGVIGQPTPLIASVPAEQIETDAQTGRLYYQAKIPNRIKLNNKNEEQVNSIRVKLTTPEGVPVQHLDHPTTILLKIND